MSIHVGVHCDACQCKPIVGLRYKCGNCADYDLCAACFSGFHGHSAEHVFLVITRPMADATLCTGTPLLQNVNLYPSTAPAVETSNTADVRLFAPSFHLNAAFPGMMAQYFRNAVVSPASVACVMGLLNYGASDGVARELSPLFRTRQDGLDFASKFTAMPGVTVANSLWLSSTMAGRINEPFVQSISGPLGGLDVFTDDVTPGKIDAWISTRTKGAIPKFGQNGGGGHQNSESDMIIVNAVYFRGKWRYPFQPAIPAPFYTDASRTTKIASGHASMMHWREAVTLPAISHADYAAVALPYLEHGLEMYVAVPTRADEVSRAAALGIVCDVKAFNGACVRQDVRVRLPKYRGTYGPLELRQFFQSRLTCKSMFNPFAANFPGFAQVLLNVVSISQQVMLDIDEQGTTAAAATMATFMSFSGSRAPSPVLRIDCDCPFSLSIVDSSNGIVLFAGTINLA